VVGLVVATPVRFRAAVTPVAARALSLARGSRVWLIVKALAFHRLE
jgi:hypothetical protein